MSIEQGNNQSDKAAVATWACGPLAALMDSYPAISAISHTQESINCAAFSRFCEGARKIPSLTPHDEVVVSEIMARSPQILEETMEIIRDIGGGAAILTAIEVSPGHFIDSDSANMRIPYLQHNVYGLALNKMRENSAVHKVVRTISSATLAMLEKVSETQDPRILVASAKKSNTPVFSLTKMCAKILDISAVSTGKYKVPEEITDPSGDIAICLNIASSTRIPNVENYPMVPIDSMVEYIMVNFGMARKLYDKVPNYLAKSIVEESLLKIGKNARLRPQEHRARINDVEKKIRTNQYRNNESLKARVEAIVSTGNIWLDTTYWKEMMTRPPVTIPNVNLSSSNIVSLLHIQADGLKLGDEEVSITLPSIAHVVATIAVTTLFTEHRSIFDVPSMEELKRIYDEEVCLGSGIVTPEEALTNANNLIMIRGRERLASIINNVRQEEYSERDWMPSLVRIYEKSGQTVVGLNDNNLETIRQSVEYERLKVSEEVMEITMDTVQRHKVTTMMISQRVAEIINVTSGIFAYNDEEEELDTTNVAKCVAGHACIMDGAFVAPNTLTHQYPKLYNSLIDMISNYHYPISEARGATVQSISYNQYKALFKFVTALALVETYNRINQTIKGTKITLLDDALVKLSHDFAAQERDAAAKLTDDDLVYAIAHMTMRTAAASVSNNQLDLPGIEKFFKASLKALVAGNNLLAVEAVSNVYNKPLYSDKHAPVYNTIDDVDPKVVLKAIGSTTNAVISHAATHISTLRNMRPVLELGKVILWARAPPAQVLQFKGLMIRDYNPALSFVGTIGSQNVPVLRDYVLPNIEHLAKALDTTVAPISSGSVAGTVNALKGLLKVAIEAAAQRVELVALGMNMTYTDVSDIMEDATKMLLCTNEYDDQIRDLFASSAATPLSVDSIASAAQFIVNNIVKIVPSEDISIKRITRLASALKLTTDLLPFRAIEYIAPNVNIYHNSTASAIAEDDVHAGRFIVNKSSKIVTKRARIMEDLFGFDSDTEN